MRCSWDSCGLALSAFIRSGLLLALVACTGCSGFLSLGLDQLPWLSVTAGTQAENVATPDELGYWELSRQGYTAPVLQLSGTDADAAAGLADPLPDLAVLDTSTERFFLAFDQDTRLVGGYASAASASVVYVESPASFPVIGAPRVDAGDGTWTWTGGAVSRFDNAVVSTQVTMTLLALDAERCGVTIVALHTLLPSGTDPNTPFDELAAGVGTGVTWTSSAVYVMESSPGPYAELPDARFVPRANSGHEVPRSPAGTWLLVEHDDHVASWVDPNAPLARYCQELAGRENPFSFEGNDETQFVVLDTTPTIVATYTCVPSDNTGYIGTPADDLFLGQTGVLQPDGRIVIDARAQTQSGFNSMAITMQGRVVLVPGADGESWSAVVEYTVSLVASENIAENATTGRPAISAGTATAHVTRWTVALQPSSGPFALCPDALWVAPPPWSGQDQVPAGYYEFADPHDGLAGWSDPASPLALLIPNNNFPSANLIGAANERVFCYFDDEGTFLFSCSYYPAEDTVRVDAWGENPLLGKRPQRDGEQSRWVWTSASPSVGGGGSVSSAMRVDVAIFDGENQSGRTAMITFAVTCTATAEIPADPQTGRPTIPAGTTVTWIAQEYYTAMSSPGPYQLFPTATFVVLTPE